MEKSHESPRTFSKDYSNKKIFSIKQSQEMKAPETKILVGIGVQG